MEGEESAATGRAAGKGEGMREVSVLRAQEGSNKEIYVVKGQDSEGVFEVMRKTKDFNLMRKLLLVQWPGVYLPTIKAKYTEIHDSHADINERKRATLEGFLTHIMLIPSLFHCKTMRIFLFSGPNYAKSIGDLKPPSYQSTSENYLRAFSLFIKETEVDCSIQLEKQVNSLKFALNQAIKLQKLGRELSGFYNNLIDSSERLDKCFETYELDVISECARSEVGNYRPVFKRIVRETSRNPYLIVLNWAKREEMEISAMLEALEASKYLRNELERLESKRRNETKHVEKLQTGKFTLGALLSLRTKAANILELEADLRWVLLT